MNRYGRLAQEHWRRHAPNRYAALEDPEEFFETLGESAATQIAETTRQMERQLPADLDGFDRVGQMRAIQKQAEELVLTDLVYSVTIEPANLTEELEEMLGDLPTPSAIEDSLDRLQAEAEDNAAAEGWSQPGLTEEQEARRRQLTTLLPLVRLGQEPSEMSESDLRDRILALRPFWDPETHSLIPAP